MSGGVDSSVAAALLKEQGHELIGVYFKLCPSDVCQKKSAQEAAQRVCKKLNIPFKSISLKKDFKKKVIEYFVNAYSKGRTPNPCVICNKYIKFGEFVKQAKKLGCERVASGHYSRITHHVSRNKFKLQKAKDKEKDQTYFLHQLKQGQLRKIIFPLGKYTKQEVRAMADKMKLPYLKKESQEICFVNDKQLAEFLTAKMKVETGRMKDMQTKKILGEHNGLVFYTIGQRKGIGLAGGPWFVAKLDTRTNTLWVTKDEKDLLSRELTVKNINWISGYAPKLPIGVKCRIRYRSTEVSATIHKSGANKLKVKFTKQQRAVTSGQFCVFWKGKECLGGGEIC